MPINSGRTRVLVVEDEQDIAGLIKHALEREGGFFIEIAGSGDMALKSVAEEVPDLVLLDLNLPVLNGVEVCRIMRGRPETAKVPIIMVTARSTESDRITGLDIGADDYITKPFSNVEFAARIRANLRRAQASQIAASVQPMQIGSLVADFTARVLRRGSETIHLTPIEWELLRTFVTQAGRTLTHQQIFNAVWGRAFGDPQQYLRVHVANLRRKIETDPVRPQLIVTEPGVGYRFELPR
jgi:DNA-binding response OmpR family regulator